VLRRVNEISANRARGLVNAKRPRSGHGFRIVAAVGGERVFWKVDVM
jgi:hypothetical protein